MSGNALGKFDFTPIARKRPLIAPKAMSISIVYLDRNPVALIAQIIHLKIQVERIPPPILSRRVGQYQSPVFSEHLKALSCPLWIESRGQIQIAHTYFPGIVNGHIERKYRQSRPVGLQVTQG